MAKDPISSSCVVTALELLINIDVEPLGGAMSVAMQHLSTIYMLMQAVQRLLFQAFVNQPLKG